MKNVFTLIALLTIALSISSCTNNQPKEVEQNKNQEEQQVQPEQIAIAQASSDMLMHVDYAKSIARMAYIWAYPMINMTNRRTVLSAAPEPGRLADVLPASPTGQIAMLYDYIDPGQNFIACPNQDVVYGLGFLSLNKQPVAIQIPEIKDRFWVYAIYDQRTDQVGELGQPYDTKPGFYLLVGPEWNSEKP